MGPPPRDCPGICDKLPAVLGDIRADIREMRVEYREVREQFAVNLDRIEKLCPQHDTRIRACENDILAARTVISLIPWTRKALWCLVGIIFFGAVWFIAKILPALTAHTPMAMGP